MRFEIKTFVLVQWQQKRAATINSVLKTVQRRPSSSLNGSAAMQCTDGVQEFYISP